MALNFNIDPYYDDFDPSKNFYRVLFKPGYAVQARELTQAQTILQDQITKFASNIFEQNTPISGGKITTNLNCHFIKLQASYNGITTDVTKFNGQTIQDATGTILAKVIIAIPATGTGGDPPTLIVSYLSGSQFPDGAVIYASSINYQAQALALYASGSSSTVSISQGVYFVSSNYTRDDGIIITNGTFVQVNPQTIVLNKYDNVPSLRVGLNINESIQYANADASLLDPAVGASNYQAPGADRYLITLTLESRPLSLGDDQNFIEVVRVNNGQIIQLFTSTQYSIINDYLAQRTFETNGDFIVDDFNLNSLANTATPNIHNGYTQYDLRIGKGVAYVHGYRLENQSDLTLTNDRAQTTESQKNNYNYVDYGQYFYVDSVNGLFDVTTGQKVDLHCVANASVVSSNTTTYNSTLIGSGYIRGLEYDHNLSDANTASYVYKAYVYDIVTNSLSDKPDTGTTTTITLPNSPRYSSVANAYYGVTVTITEGPSSGDSRKIVNYNGSTRVATVDVPFTVAPTAISVFSLQFGTKDVESISNNVAHANINIEGKFNGVATNDTFYENPSSPELIYNIGYPYVASVSDTSYSSTQVFRNKAFSGSGPATLSISQYPISLQGVVAFTGGPGILSADTIKQNYTAIVLDNGGDTTNNGAVGSVLNLADTSNTTVSISGSTLTISSSKFKTPLTISLIAKVNILQADNTQHILKRKTLISGNTTSNTAVSSSTVVDGNTYVDLTNSQVYIKNAGLVTVGQTQSLYVNDVKKIVKIIDSLNPASNVTDVMLSDSAYDITSKFTFDNGQRDSIYDHASIKLKPGVAKPKGNILVIFDYYTHAIQIADGYFSYMSYVNEKYSDIPSYTSSRGIKYSLRDCVDFRPSRQNGTSTYVLEFTGNPNIDDTGTYIPQDLTNFISDYSYYLGRKDKLILSKDKNFQIIQGNPALNPALPNEPDGCLLIANLSHDPYTAYVSSETPAGVLPNLSIQKVFHRRWRMEDITNLEGRFYAYTTTLSSLEQLAANRQIPDINGVNRIKTAVIVDDFTSYGIVDTSNPDFSASIDTLKKRLSAPQDVFNYALQANANLLGLNQLSETTLAQLGYQTHTVGRNSRYFTLPYTNTPVVTQPLASRTLNLNPFSIQIFQGVCSLYPPMDNWVDNTVAPDLLLANIDNLIQSSTINATNVNNWQAIPGTQYSTANTSALVSSYTLNNSYITNNSIQPYIRAQEFIVRAKNMKVNTPVNCYFDSVNVNNYMTNPDIIELKNSVGNFVEDDVIGIKNSNDNTFYPIAVVAYVYKYPNSSNVRLYVTSNFHTDYNAISGGENITDIVSNAKFDANGNYVSNTAFGRITNTNIITTKNNGNIISVGGSFTDANSVSIPGIYSVSAAGYGTFPQSYAIWNTQDRSGPLFDVTFPLTVSANATYYFAAMGDDEVLVYLDGVKIMGLTQGTYTSGDLFEYSAALVTGKTYKIRVLNTQGDGDAFVAVAISDKVWYPGTSGGPFSRDSTTTGTVIWSTRTPWQNSLPAGISGVSQMFALPGGGIYYTGVSQIGLNPLSNSTSNTVYIGSTINITTNYISYVSPTDTSPGALTTYNFSANVVAYDSTTRVVTLDKTISVSKGQNSKYGLIDSTYSIFGTANNYVLSQQTGGVSALATNENGAFCGIFNLPAATFTNNTKVFRIDNREILNDPSTATTYAEATFWASSLYNKNSAEFSPSVVAASQVVIPTAVAPTVIVNPSTLTNLLDPIAQTFSIDKKSYPNGMFLNSMKFFFKTKATTTQSPVNLSIVATKNGVPTGLTLDNSIVSLTPDEINISTTPNYKDDATATEFKFAAPVYIQSGVTYSIILQSQSTEYNIYIAAQNDTALQSSVGANNATITKITATPYTGSLYETQNSVQWTGDATKSLMFVITRCLFDKTKSPKIPFVIPAGSPTHKFVQQDIANYYGRSLINSPNNITTNDSFIDEINVTVTDFTPTNTNILYTYQATLKSTGLFDSEKSIIPGRMGAPNLHNETFNDGKGPRMLQAVSPDSFVLYANMSTNDDAMTPIIADDGTTLFNIQYGINNLPLSNSLISLTYGGEYYNAYTTTATVSPPDVVGGVQATAGVHVNNGIVDDVWIINSGSGYLKTPTLSIVDANTTPGTGAAVTVNSEFSPTGGNSISRYVSKVITLSNDNSSGDLRFYFTGYRPIGTDIHIFYRVKNTNDSQRFENGEWQLMTYINNSNKYSSNVNDLLTFQLAPGINGTANNYVAYTSKTTGLTYTSFNQFSFKVVLTTNDSTKVPYLTNLSAVSTPPGN
jgi:hypothetical protein